MFLIQEQGAGDLLGDFGNGLLVLALVAIAGFGGLGKTKADDVPEATKNQRAAKYGNGLFAIALVIPATALAGTFLFKQFPAYFDVKQVTLISLALGVLLALAVQRRCVDAELFRRIERHQPG